MGSKTFMQIMRKRSGKINRNNNNSNTGKSSRKINRSHDNYCLY